MNTPTTPPGTKPFDASQLHVGCRLIRRDGVEGKYVGPLTNDMRHGHAIKWNDRAVICGVQADGSMWGPTEAPSHLDAFLPATPIPPAIVWQFRHAPEELRSLSTNGGDEDWLVELPPGCEDDGMPLWIEVMDSCRDPRSYAHPTKPDWKVIIGAHA